ncbi:MAG TPA: radical SAM protein [Chloroflexota bacterium]|nr:radical SAM protein [Chloroflexota bacterium]
MVSTARIGENGDIQLPDVYRRRWGLDPGADLMVQETPEGLLIRRADPPLTKLYVEPTNLCNLRCRTCVRNSWSDPQGTMSIELYRRMADGLRNLPSLRQVNFWGIGEPLLHPDIVEMVELAKGLGARTQMITNGLLLTRELGAGLLSVGLDSLVVSVDGASPEVQADVRSGADLNRMKNNLIGLREVCLEREMAWPEIGIEFVAMRSNVDQLREIRSLAVFLGASFIVVTNLLPYNREMSDEILYGMYAGGCYPMYRTRWTPEIILPRMDNRQEVMEPVMRMLEHTNSNDFPRARLDGAGGYCRFVGEGAAAVGWSGDVSPCIALMHSYPVYVMGRQKQIRRYVLGNVGEEEITSIWDKEEYVAFRRRVQRWEFSPCTDCGGCHLADFNEEDCFGNTHPVCGDCLWAKGVIQCP